MNDLIYYVTCLQLKSQQIFLLWRDGKEQPDSFVLRQHAPMKLLFTKTIEELEDYAMSNGFVLSDEPVQLIDFNALKTALSGLRIDRSVSERSCKFILEAWNTFDDISHTINSPLVPIDLFPKEDVDKSYEKIFYGTNLEPVTPAGCGYSPLLVPKELKMIRTLFRAAVKGLSSIVGYEIW